MWQGQTSIRVINAFYYMAGIISGEKRLRNRLALVQDVERYISWVLQAL